MQYLEDDMDTLFRDAAENYPLRLPENGWSKVAAGLPGAAAPVITARKDKRRWLLWAWCACLIAGATLFGLSDIRQTAMEKIAHLPASANTNAASIISLNAAPDSPEAEPVHITVPPEQPAMYNVARIRSRSGQSTRSGHLIPSIDKTGIDDQVPGESDYQVLTLKSSGAIGRPAIAQPKLVLRAAASLKNNGAPVVAALQRKTTPVAKGIYTALLAGPQWSQVKSQGLNRPGFSGGLLVGYRFGRRLSLETGLLASQKKYYSSGAYFKMEKAAASMPAGMEVVSLTGKSTVIEIPLALKYDVLRRSDRTLFVTAGVSAYILKKENNDYLALINGSRRQVEASYKADMKYHTAALSLSAGFEWRIHKKITARIEPYAQIPMQGIGVGNMPVMSTGMRLGLTLPLHR